MTNDLMPTHPEVEDRGESCSESRGGVARRENG
jgi:hypothetical protein